MAQGYHGQNTNGSRKLKVRLRILSLNTRRKLRFERIYGDLSISI